MLLIRSEAEAAEAFGEDHGLQVFFQRAPPVAIYALPGAGGVLPAGSRLTVEALPGTLQRLELSYDAQATPPLTCRVDGAPVELEREIDGVWRPRRAKKDG